MLNKTLELLEKLSEFSSNNLNLLITSSDKQCYVLIDDYDIDDYDNDFLSIPDVTINELECLNLFLEKLLYIASKYNIKDIDRGYFESLLATICTDKDFGKGIFIKKAYTYNSKFKEFLDSFDYFDYLRKFK